MESVGRVFLAVPIPPEIRFAIGDATTNLPIPGRRVPPANWHITLRFLDVIDTVTYERFISGFEQPVESSFRVALDGFGAFPNPQKATVFWAAVNEGAVQLSSLNEQAEESALSAGLLAEERPFHPHLTLARIRPPADVRPIVDEELQLSWRCEQLVMYRTHQRRGGVSYESLDSIDLIG